MTQCFGQRMERTQVRDEEVVPGNRSALLPAQLNQPGCRDEKKLDGCVVYERQASITEKN
jgi:hypothetical protein